MQPAPARGRRFRALGPRMRHNHRVTSDDVSADEPEVRPDSVVPDGDEGEDDPSGKRRRGQDFPVAGFLRRGYDISAVETFLHDAERASRSDPPAMAPYEVQDARFRGVRWRRGYDMQAVDERMAELHAELRERHGDRPDGVSGIQGHESVRSHRAAFWIYVTAAVLVVLIGVAVAFTFIQM